MIKRLKDYFSYTEIMIWSISSILVIVSFILFDRSSLLILAASLIGVTYLILNAKTGKVLLKLCEVIGAFLTEIICDNRSILADLLTDRALAVEKSHRILDEPFLAGIA